jgi:ankyrin repeat protein
VIHQRGEGGFTPLNIALDFDHRELADYLISNGADTSVIGAKELFDRKKYDLHMKCLAAGIEVLKQQIQEECGSAQQGTPIDVEPASRSRRD